VFSLGLISAIGPLLVSAVRAGETKRRNDAIRRAIVGMLHAGRWFIWC